ncbi:MAG: DnaJ domain-containing protein [Patescibacteria group bacterium]|nr:DnaJ domain-containing protein [Patescibacteria group bacterium]
MATQKDFYEILGVSKISSADEIKRAYRKLALQYHPDRNKSKDAEGKFKEVTKAYEVLSDPQKKQTYDQYGPQAFEQAGGPFGGGAQSGFAGGQQTGHYGPFTYTYTTGGNEGANFDFGGFSDPFEIFEQFFGGGSPFGARQRRSVYSIEIDFMEAVSGVTKQVNVDGKKQTIKIPAGVDNGSRIRFGDYDVIVQVQSHSLFKREGYDIIIDKEISFSQAALGDEIYVDTIDGEVKLRIPQGTQPGAIIRLRGKGVPQVRGSGRGDEYVRIKVVVPKNLTGRQKELLKQFELSGKSRKSWF